MCDAKRSMQQKRFKGVMKVNGVAKDVKSLPLSGVEEQQQQLESGEGLNEEQIKQK